ncbi:MAG: glycosyltransferase family 9 protein [Candidatus Binatia bacterium]
MGHRLLILFPGALGDLLCCWPAIDARRISGQTITLVARSGPLEALPAGAVMPFSIDRREVADLFATGSLNPTTRAAFGGHSEVVSFTGYGDAQFTRRLADAAGAEPAMRPFRPGRSGEHAVDYYARCLGVAPRRSKLAVDDDAAAWASAWWKARSLGSRVLAVHAGSGGTHKNWTGMAEAAAACRARGWYRVLALVGPAESERGERVPCDASACNEPLQRVAALISRAHRYLGNDSGVSHLAGLLQTRGVVVFGPTDPAVWRPAGNTLRVLHGGTPCPECGSERLCTHRISVDEVLRALVAP